MKTCNTTLKFLPERDYLKRITGMSGTHRVVLNLLTSEFKVISIYSTQYSFRGSPWSVRYTSSESACYRYVNNL